MTADDYIRLLNLQPHPEGGFFAETYRSAEMIPHGALPERFSGPRPFGTAIYFLLRSQDESALHRIQSDEIWHFYAGGPLDITIVRPDDSRYVVRLGANVAQGEVFQAVVPAGYWFGAKPVVSSTVVDSTTPGTGFTLVGCTVAPGFDFDDFQLFT